MPYATQSDLASVLTDGQLAQLTADSGTSADATIVSKALADASAEMDGYLAGRYVVPVTGGSTDLDILRPHCLKLTKWLLYGRRAIGGDYQELERDYKTTIAWLSGIRDGKGSLPSAAERSSVATVTDRPANYGGLPSVFSSLVEGVSASGERYYGL